MAEEKDKPEHHECGTSTCLFHSGMVVQNQEYGRRLADQRNERGLMWDAIKDKVPIRYFVLLVTFVVCGLGFQLMIYDSIKTVDKKIAIIEVTVQAALNSQGN